ncbi:MAG: helix-hairpin-helix domain-containing protein [Bacilli bacterium]
MLELKNIREHAKKVIGPSLLLCLGLAGSGWYFLQPQLRAETSITDEETQSVKVGQPKVNEGVESAEDEPTTCVVDVKGAVKKPGIYSISHTARVWDVIEKAGGLLPNADGKGVNFAAKVYDEMLIFVAEKGDETQSESSATPETVTKISINRATQAELEELPNIGPQKAKAILAFREEQGHFSKVEQLMDVPGIGERTFEMLKSYITL